MNRSIQPALAWKPAADTEYGDIRYEVAEGIAKLTICRPEVRNAFRPRTLFELQDAFERARSDPTVGVIVLTGEGAQAFCSGGDQRIRGDDGYVGDDGIGRLNVLDLQVQIRRLPKPVVAMVAGYAIGGGHVLHVVCDLTIAADDGLAGIQQLAGDATLLYYMSEEAQEGKQAYLEKRRPEFDRFPKRP